MLVVEITILARLLLLGGIIVSKLAAGVFMLIKDPDQHWFTTPTPPCKVVIYSYICQTPFINSLMYNVNQI